MQYIEPIWYTDQEKLDEFLDNLAPVVIFAYNRLEHTKRMIEALQKNLYAKQTLVFIFSDGAKDKSAEQAVNCVRDYLHTISGFKTIQIIERQENWGLARNIISGVTDIVNLYGKIIVLEDDIITSPWFLKYMNDALEIYKKEKLVLQVGGYTHPICKKGLEKIFFVQKTDCWGWGIWQDRWALFERNPEELMKSFSKDDIYKFNMNGAFDFWNQVKENHEGKLFTWAVFLQVVGFRHKMVTVYPKVSMTKNSGMDATGEHCNTTSVYDVELADEPINLFPKRIEDNLLAESYMRDWFKRLHGSLLRRCLRKIKIAISSYFEV